MGEWPGVDGTTAIARLLHFRAVHLAGASHSWRSRLAAITPAAIIGIDSLPDALPNLPRAIDVIFLSQSGCDIRAVCSLIRGSGVRAPMIYLADIHSQSEEVRVLGEGMTDYIGWTCSDDLFAARVHAHVRERVLSSTGEVALDTGFFSPSERALIGSSRRARLTRRESDVLRLIASECGRSVAIASIKSMIGGSSISDHAIETTIYRIRQKMIEVGLNPLAVLRRGPTYHLARS